MKRRGRIKIEGTKTIFFCLTQNQKQKQKKLNQFKIFCTGSKNFVLVQKFCTGSQKIVPKAKIELQQIYSYIIMLLLLSELHCNTKFYSVITPTFGSASQHSLMSFANLSGQVLGIVNL